MVLVLGIEVSMKPLMAPSELALLCLTSRALGAIVTFGSPSLGSQCLVAPLVVFGKLFMDAPVLPSAFVSKG